MFQNSYEQVIASKCNWVRGYSKMLLFCHVLLTALVCSVLSTALFCSALRPCLLLSSSSLVGDLTSKPFVWVLRQNRQRDPLTGTNTHRNDCVTKMLWSKWLLQNDIEQMFASRLKYYSQIQLSMWLLQDIKSLL